MDIKKIAKMTTTEPNNNFIYKFHLCKFNIFRDINIQIEHACFTGFAIFYSALHRYTYKIYTAA